MLVGFRRMGAGCGELARGPCWPDRASVLPGRAVRSQHPQPLQGSKSEAGVSPVPQAAQDLGELAKTGSKKASETGLYLEPLGTLGAETVGKKPRDVQSPQWYHSATA